MNIQNLSYETYCKGKMQYTYGNIAICCDFRPSKSLFVVIVRRKRLKDIEIKKNTELFESPAKIKFTRFVGCLLVLPIKQTGIFIQDSFLP